MQNKSTRKLTVIFKAILNMNISVYWSGYYNIIGSILCNSIIDHVHWIFLFCDILWLHHGFHSLSLSTGTKLITHASSAKYNAKCVLFTRCIYHCIWKQCDCTYMNDMTHNIVLKVAVLAHVVHYWYFYYSNATSTQNLYNVI